jgi:CheY-like chemotaxis protein
MPNGGTFRVAADNTRVDEENPRRLPAGRYVRIQLADNGPGITRENLEHIFDPYFTTKQSGSGLGLATVYSIVEKHGGAVEVESTPGVGTTFTLVLPASAGPVAPATTAPARPAAAEGRVLILDDQEQVLRTGARMLTALGYDAVCVTRGEDAVAACTAANAGGQPFDAVILDLTIRGGMGGVDTLHELRKICPDICAIAASGYSTDPVLANHASYGFRAVITKPYTAEAFAAALTQALGA